jgi:hypothetical protein
MGKGKNRNPELAHLMDRNAFVEAGRLRQEAVPLPESGALLVREFDARDYIEYMSYFKYDDKGEPSWAEVERMEFYKFVVHLGAINPDGSRMFPAFSDMPSLRADFLRPAADCILRLSGLKKEVADNLPNAEGTSSITSESDSESLPTK